MADYVGDSLAYLMELIMLLVSIKTCNQLRAKSSTAILFKISSCATALIVLFTLHKELSYIWPLIFAQSTLAHLHLGTGTNS